MLFNFENVFQQNRNMLLHHAMITFMPGFVQRLRKNHYCMVFILRQTWETFSNNVMWQYYEYMVPLYCFQKEGEKREKLPNLSVNLLCRKEKKKLAFRSLAMKISKRWECGAENENDTESRVVLTRPGRRGSLAGALMVYCEMQPAKFVTGSILFPLYIHAQSSNVFLCSTSRCAPSRSPLYTPRAGCSASLPTLLCLTR